MVERSVSGVQDIAVFIAVAESAGFTRAAERLGITKSNAGKAVQRLEARLGTKLFQRTTRAVRLTEDGETYLDAARKALEGLADAENALAARRAEPAGRVRLDIAAGLGRLLLPTMTEIREKYPKVSFEVSLSDRQSDAVKEGWDLVVRVGPLPESGEMTVRKLCDLRLGLYVSPEYLERRGHPASVAALRDHDAAVFRQGSGSLRPWTVHDGSQNIEMLPASAAIILADGQALVEAAVMGFGIAQIFDRVAEPHVAAGRLVHVLPEADVSGPPVHALVPLGRRMPRKTRLLLDHVAEVLKRQPSS
jgi:DNA-binding transcriptional LysR family regulator